MAASKCDQDFKIENGLLLSVNTLVVILLILELGSRDLISKGVVLSTLVVISVLLVVLAIQLRVRRDRRLNQSSNNFSVRESSDGLIKNKFFALQSISFFLCLFLLASFKCFIPNLIKGKQLVLQNAVVKSIRNPGSEFDIQLIQGNQEYPLTVNSLFDSRMDQIQAGDKVRFSHHEKQVIALYKGQVPVFTFEEYLQERRSMEQRLGTVFYILAFGYLFWFVYKILRAKA
ncbi:hypothetical protein [Gimesia chilikensis]|uniref:Uncharacterized protein n=1 Tax=Gimesia chilikensis TaxID=2605989 RepID=A0A517PXA2_9PLAN|nr:hypothetical protein [Gimesia chilikensis]QDT24017.1 hypothetical protein HG66A1_58430 [Gimesia chilikensis]